MIHVIRSQQVMIDCELARLYGVETKYLKRASRQTPPCRQAQRGTGYNYKT